MYRMITEDHSNSKLLDLDYQLNKNKNIYEN